MHDRSVPAPRISGKETPLAGIAGLGRGLFASGYVVFMSFAPPLLLLDGFSVSEATLLTSIAAVVPSVWAGSGPSLHTAAMSGKEKMAQPKCRDPVKEQRPF